MTWDPTHNYCRQCERFVSAEESEDCPARPDCYVARAIEATFAPKSKRGQAATLEADPDQ